MNTTEAVRGPGELAALEPAPSARLPITAGDAALPRVEQPEHDWPGRLFIWLSKMASLCMGLAAAGGILAMAMDTGPFPGELWLVGMLAVGAVLQRSLARSVEHFTRWGWYGAMAELSLATLAKVAAVAADPGSFVGAGLGITVDLLWLQYFWAHRRDFDIDVDL